MDINQQLLHPAIVQYMRTYKLYRYMCTLWKCGTLFRSEQLQCSSYHSFAIYIGKASADEMLPDAQGALARDLSPFAISNINIIRRSQVKWSRLHFMIHEIYFCKIFKRPIYKIVLLKIKF